MVSLEKCFHDKKNLLDTLLGHEVEKISKFVDGQH